VDIRQLAIGNDIVETLIKDIRYGIRSLLKRPAFTTVAVITLALGIGSTTTIFSVVDALLLRGLPYPNADRLVLLREVGAKGNQMAVAEPNFEDVQARSQSFDALAISAGSAPLVVTGGNEPAHARVTITSRRFFEVMGVQPLVGRAFLPEEEKYGGPVAALVSHGYWQKMLGGRADFGAVKLNVDGVSCNIVGVMPPGFDYPAETEVWATRNTEPPNPSRTAHNWPVIGRLRAGVTVAQAHAELSVIGKQLRQTYGEGMDAVDFALIPLQTYLTRNVRQGLWLLLGAGSLLLLMACANYANLLLAQFTTRQREFTVRAAMGASRWRLAQQLIIENALVTLPAAALGALLASFGASLLLLLGKDMLPRVNAIAVDGRVLGFSCGLAVLIAVALGLLPALRLGKQNLQAGLKEGRGQSADGTKKRLRGALVAAQIGLTLMLFAGAGLLGRSFLKLMQIDPGFKTDSAMAMNLSLPSTITPQEDERLRQFYLQLLERVGHLPGVTAVGGINVLPLSGRGANGTFLINDDPAQRGYAEYRVASAGYFAAMNIPLLHGRVFDRSDKVSSPHVAVISQSLAQRYWPIEDPLGKRIQFGNMDTDKHLLHVVGVVGDVRDATLDREARPTVYAFSLQRPQWWQVSRLAIVVRTQTNPQALVPALGATVQSLRADVPMSFKTLDKVFSSSLDSRRFSLVIFGVFAVTALVLGGAGIYGVMSYVVTQRTHEIGIRMALGARAADVLRLIVKNGMGPVLLGVAIGLAGALAVTRLMASLLFGVSPTDALTFAIASLGVIVVALVACYVPARRATKVDPLVALRYE
jgi:putative ABC transport system permease protein